MEAQDTCRPLTQWMEAAYFKRWLPIDVSDFLINRDVSSFSACSKDRAFPFSGNIWSSGFPSGQEPEIRALLGGLYASNSAKNNAAEFADVAAEEPKVSVAGWTLIRKSRFFKLDILTAILLLAISKYDKLSAHILFRLLMFAQKIYFSDCVKS